MSRFASAGRAVVIVDVALALWALRNAGYAAIDAAVGTSGWRIAVAVLAARTARATVARLALEKEKP